MIIRPYQPEDIHACVEVFTSNIPKYFSVDERTAFVDFLRRTPGTYLVICDDNGAIVGCGGIAISRDDEHAACLTWGMVSADKHGHGFGRALTQARLALLPTLSGVSVLRIDTSHETEAFYKKFGFVTVRRVEHGYREGLHRCDMERPA